ncbi:MAG: cysteine dioxygenase [Phenylobacterium sp.]|uniref:cysteine dioxygenase family protein n=1 Tax=Phenylobacterium sp. TaxID=1871053 RepID=UPI002733CB56|nr:cysteine dioxygenase [Phenylobacterium sp.]MDP3747673.1 cysteine dioxygenase [Phenylobacterium sp.]
MVEAEPTELTGRRRLKVFLAGLAAQVAQAGDDEAAVLRGAAPCLQALVSHDDWLDDEFGEPDPEHGRQYLLYCDPLRRFSVVSVVWGPGHDTPIHDHTTWGLVGVLRGAELEETFALEEGRPVKRGESRLEPGDVVTLSPRHGDIHRVRNAFDDRVSISIHVYGGDIGAIQRHMYSEDGEVRTFATGYANRFLPNVWGAAAA